MKTRIFGLKLSNLPHINIRLDFNSLLALFRNETFRKQFKGYKGKRIPVKTHYFTWHGRPNALLTYLLRDAIVGLECAVSGAVFDEACNLGLMSEQIAEATKNPLSLKKRGTAACVFVGLPELIRENISLDIMNPDLWGRLQIFYREVRNPIFHAYEVGDDDPEPVWKCLELVWEAYQWLNSWHPISNLTSGPISWNPKMLERMGNIPELEDLLVKQIIPERSLPDNGMEYLQFLPQCMSLLQIEETNGLATGTGESIDISLTDEKGNPVKIVISPHAAMRLLVMLALAQKARGWELPDRI